MAAAHLRLTRRALLAGACAAPLLPSAPPAAGRLPTTFLLPDHAAGEGTATPPEANGESFVVTNWDRAIEKYQIAEAALAAAVHTDDEALYDRLGTRHDRALQRLLLNPAPTIAALGLKLDLTLYERAEEFLGDAPAMRALKQDAHRLATSSR